MGSWSGSFTEDYYDRHILRIILSSSGICAFFLKNGNLLEGLIWLKTASIVSVGDKIDAAFTSIRQRFVVFEGLN